MTIKQRIEEVLPIRVNYWIKILNSKNEVKKWIKSGKPAPPPHVIKQLTIAEYQEKYNINCLVETGTYLGDMVYAQRKKFSKIHSIELGKKIYENALKRFKKFPHIKIHFGDSGIILNEIVPHLEEKSIFWLDGHYSGGITAKGDTECPIFEELEAIFRKDLGHIILIDDARCFNGQGDYPLVDELILFIQQKNKDYMISVKDDIIRAVVK